MNILPIIKGVARLVASASAGTVVSSIIKTNTPANLNKLEKGLMIVGEYVVSGVIADLSADYLVNQIDAITKKDEKPEEKEDFSI